MFIHGSFIVHREVWSRGIDMDTDNPFFSFKIIPDKHESWLWQVLQRLFTASYLYINLYPCLPRYKYMEQNKRKVGSMVVWASLVAQRVRNPPAMLETWVQSLDWEVPLEKGTATHSSILSWRIPIDREAWWATEYWVTKSQTQLSN